MKKAIIFLAEGFEEVEALTPADVLRRAGIEVITVSISDTLQVTGARQITVTADACFNDINYKSADILILPGGIPGATNLYNHAGLKNLIQEFARENKWLAAICAAPMVLGELELLKGKTVTCYPGFESHLKGANVTTKPVVTDENIITGKGVGAAMAFSLRLVEILTDKKTAEDLSEKMVVV